MNAGQDTDDDDGDQNQDQRVLDQALALRFMYLFHIFPLEPLFIGFIECLRLFITRSKRLPVRVGTMSVKAL